MAVIDSLFVKLGLKTDQESFSKGEANFERLKDRARLMGAAMSGAGGALLKLNHEFASRYDQVAKFARANQIAASEVTGLMYALERIGGQQSDAFPLIEKMNSNLAKGSFLVKSFGEDLLKLKGFNPNFLEGANNANDALERTQRLLKEVEKADGIGQRNAVGLALGLNQPQIDLLTSGNSLKELINESNKLRPVTDEMLKNAEAYRDTTSMLAQATKGLTDIVGNRLTGALVSITGDTEDLVRLREKFNSEYEKAIAVFSRLFTAVDKLANGDIVGATKEAGVAGDSIPDSVKWAFKNGTPFGWAYQAGEKASTALSNAFTINVDARGSTNPVETEAAVRRGIEATKDKLESQTKGTLK